MADQTEHSAEIIRSQKTLQRWLRLAMWSWYVLAFCFSLRSEALAQVPVAVTAITLLGGAYFLYLVQKSKRITTWFTTCIQRISAVHTIIFLLPALALAFSLRLAWGMAVQTPPYSDFAVYHQAAVALAQGGSPPPDKPLGYPFILALWYRIGMNQAGYLLNAILSTGTVALVYFLASWLTRDPVTAKVAALLIAIWPADIFVSSVLASEPSYAFFLWLAYLVVLIALDALDHSIKVGLALLLLSALLLAFSDTIRPVSIILVLPVLVVLLLRNDGLGIRVRLAVAVGFVVVAGLASQTLIRAASTLTPETIPMPSQRWGYIFLIGTNSSSWGRYNDDDVRLIAGLSGNEFEKNLAALKLGLERIRDRPKAFLALLPKKFMVMWGDDTYGARFSIHGTRWVTTNVSGYAVYVSQVYWCLIMLFGLTYLWSMGHPIPGSLRGLMLLLLISVAFFEFWEVQPRYHHYLMPILAVMAAMGLTHPRSNKVSKSVGTPG